MAWTKAKTAVVVGVAALLAATSTTVIGVKLIQAHRAKTEPLAALSPIMMNVTADIAPDGTVRLQAIVEETNSTGRTIHTERIGDANLDIDQITDEFGKPMKFIQQPGGGHLVNLDHAVPSGGTISYTVEGTVPHMIKSTSAGIYEFGETQNQGNDSDMHLIEVWRLPTGATLLAKDPNIDEITNDGQIELRIDKIIAPKGGLAARFRYRLAAATN